MKKLKADDILALVQKILDDGKAIDVVTIPLAGKTSIADYMVIASGTSQRHVAALAEQIAFDLKQKGMQISLEGKAGGEWVIVDALDVIVHIFYPETRQFYDLEDMWQRAPVRPENK